MPFRAIPRELFIKYLLGLGLESKGSVGSHQKWNYPKGRQQLRRPIIIRPGKDRDIPAAHIRSCAMCLDKTMQQVYEEIERLRK